MKSIINFIKINNKSTLFKVTKILLIIIYIFIEIVKAQDTFSYLSPITQQVMANCKSKGDSGVRQFSECDREIAFFSVVISYYFFLNY